MQKHFVVENQINEEMMDLSEVINFYEDKELLEDDEEE